MSANLDALVNEIRAKRSEKLPQAKARLEKLKAAKEAVLTTRTRAAAVAANNPDLQAKLGGISYDKVLTSINAAIEANERSVSRLSRESINIGVAGKSGQGKSQILQKLTGLTDEQIPTGGGAACTAARSIVHNGPSRSAKVHYLTRDGLLAKKVYPSYEPRQKDKPFALGLSSRRPVSLEDFLTMELPNVEAGDGTPTQAEDNWLKVLDLQRILRAHPELVGKLGAEAESVDIARVRDYIVKDNGETLHNVVEFVEITTPFEIGLPNGLTVYDLPGLADPTPGIREDMFASLKNDADIVLFLRKAATDGDRDLWWDVDKAAIDLMKGVYSVEEVKPADWIQLVLNLDLREGHVNSRNTEELRKTVTKGFVPVVCDCGKSDAVHAMINENIERLVGNVARIDDLRIRQADADYSVAMDEVRSLHSKLSEINVSIVSDEKWFDVHFEEFMTPLCTFPAVQDEDAKSSYEKFKMPIEDMLVDSFRGASERVDEIYNECEEKSLQRFPLEFPAFSRHELTNKLTTETMSPDYAVRNQREALLKLLRKELSECCGKLQDHYFATVVCLLFSNTRISQLVGGVGSAMAPREAILKLRDALKTNGSPLPTLDAALEDLLRFDISFETALLPPLYSIDTLVNDFNPDAPSDEYRSFVNSLMLTEKSRRGALFYNWLKDRTLAILSQTVMPEGQSLISKILEYVANAMFANFNAFVSRFVFGDDCRYEWRSFVRGHLGVLWPDEYKSLLASSALATAWNDAIAGLAKVEK